MVCRREGGDCDRLAMASSTEGGFGDRLRDLGTWEGRFGGNHGAGCRGTGDLRTISIQGFRLNVLPRGGSPNPVHARAKETGLRPHSPAPKPWPMADRVAPTY